MFSNSIRKSLVVGAAVYLSLLLSQMSYAQQTQSFRRFNFPDRHIRHWTFLPQLDPIAGDKLGRMDATIRLFPLLVGRCNSFESVNYPDHFLRHESFRFKSDTRTDDEFFKQDSAFCMKPGLAEPADRSFESVNLPRRYLGHFNFELWPGKYESSRTFRMDATFTFARPQTEYSLQYELTEATSFEPGRSELIPLHFESCFGGPGLLISMR